MKFRTINLLYYVNLKTQSTLGIKNKMLGQARAFSLHGLTANLICLDGANLVKVIFKNGSNSNKVVLKAGIPVGQFFKHLLMISDSQEADEAYYIRFTPMVNSALVDFVASINNARECVFMEIPTLPYDKELTPKVLASDTHYKQKLRGNICAYFSPTKPETMTEYLSAPIFRIHNGIDPLNLPFNKVNISAGCFRLIGVGWLSKWHGYDRIIKSIAAHKYLDDGSKVELHIVGTGGAHAELEALSVSLNLQEHVFFHGSAQGEALDDIFSRCHLAVGTLALFRLNLNYAETLKNREYLARGLPILIGHDDVICNGNYQGIYSVANDDSEIAIQPIWLKVREFYETQKSADNRESAIKEFSWQQLVSEPLKIINR